MKNKIAQFLMLAVLTAGLTIFAQAKTSSIYKVTIPFDFIVGEKSFNAGDYSIVFGSITSDRNDFVIRSADGKQAAIVASGIPKYVDENMKNANLVFNVSDEHYILSEVNTHQTSVKLPDSKEKTKKPVKRVEVALAK
jgi:hypothetical protein